VFVIVLIIIYHCVCNCQSRLYSGSHGTIDIWNAAAGKYNLLGKITHSHGSVHALAITERYIIAGETLILLSHYCSISWCGDGAGHTIEEKSGFISLIRMCSMLSARACGQ